METCRFGVHKLDVRNGFHMWTSAVGLAAVKRRLGVPLHSTVNWWNVSLA